jgi:hypothetical protein
MNKSNEICWLNKSGGLSMEASEVLDCIQLTSERVKQWTKYIEGTEPGVIFFFPKVVNNEYSLLQTLPHDKSFFAPRLLQCLVFPYPNFSHDQFSFPITTIPFQACNPLSIIPIQHPRL